MAVKHLPAALKHLLALKRPNPLRCPPVAKLHALFDATLAEAQVHGAHQGWLVLSTATLVGANVPEGVAQLYKHASSAPVEGSPARRPLNMSDRTAKAELMREAALKCAEFIGVPRTIIALTSMYSAFEDDVKGALRTHSLRTLDAESTPRFISLGRGLWDSVYEPHSDKLLTKLRSFHPDFPSFIIQSYGNLLAPLGHDVPGNIGRTLTSVLGAAVLRVEGGVGPQLTSHVFGLLKARGTPGETGEDRWLSSDEGAEWVLRSVDRIAELVGSERPEIPAEVTIAKL